MQPGIRLASKTAHTAINIDDITYGTTSGAVVVYYLIELSFSSTVITGNRLFEGKHEKERKTAAV